jgi:hypothetical protein
VPPNLRNRMVSWIANDRVPLLMPWRLHYSSILLKERQSGASAVSRFCDLRNAGRLFLLTISWWAWQKPPFWSCLQR